MLTRGTERHTFIEDIDQLYDFLQAPFHSNGSNRPSKSRKQLEPTTLPVTRHARFSQRKAKTFRPHSAARSSTRLIGNFVQ